jgi:hypothetical protein
MHVRDRYYRELELVLGLRERIDEVQRPKGKGLPWEIVRKVMGEAEV